MTPDEYRCAACGGDLRIGHDDACVRCGLLWEANELDSRGVCPVCDGQLGLSRADGRRPDQRSAYRLPELGAGRTATMLLGAPPDIDDDGGSYTTGPGYEHPDAGDQG